ncbi:MAG: hypothetical protein K2N48_12835 [Muribaculaceae bacterium]|nr:hypothetical protein [Muribaculaceae bacterium]
MDRYLHEIVRKGILLSFNDSSRHTSKFKAFGLSVKTVIRLLEIERNALPAPMMEEDSKEYWINIEVSKYLKNLAFQDPEKIKDGLSYI